MKHLTFFFLSCLISCSLQSSDSDRVKRKKTDLVEKNEIQELFQNWEIDTETYVESIGDTLKINIVYTDSNSCFYDEESNQVIVNTIYYKLRDVLSEVETVVFYVEYSFLDDPKIYLHKDKSNQVNRYFVDKTHFRNVNYSLSSFTYVQVLFFRSAIDQLINGLDYYSDKDRQHFWSLLKSFSQYVSTGEDIYRSDAELFMLLVGYMNAVSGEIGMHPRVGEALKELLSRNSIEPAVVDSNIIEIREYLDKFEVRNFK